MIHLVTFASDDMRRSAELCNYSAIEHGVDNTIRWESIPNKGRHPDVNYLMEVLPETEYWARGFGYWKWKPAIIHDALRLKPIVNDDDILIYSDAGVEFINNVSHIIDRMDQDIFLFGNNWEHAHWCKRDIVDAVFWDYAVPEDPWSKFGKQAQASVIFFRVSDYTRKFVKAWLHFCLLDGGRLIDDSPSRTPNHPEFQENRHDQAILTTMAYRDGIKLHWWPAIYNDGQFTYEKLPVYASDDYPPIFHHHRRRNHEWSNAA